MIDDSEIIKAISNPVRLKLIKCLSEKDMNVNKLINNCGLSQSAVSQHLNKLKTSGIITAKKEGREVIYSLKFPQAAKISNLFNDIIKEIQK